ncbi:hypothetical protein LTR35_004327 [Friedmanniomyces endolithicus]|uniref:Carboxylic ester hydrolase n=1 Tax=Friedmanniomyces endolithicus TaxID=329885 RepID=A0AAN6FY59_9PEZI|nr:hypothetical protein LTS00_013724 [Friedmanniomyces endolithicus]KAK0286858.1 hypothetical protein LTR35_004327 [Friedmanniomyces endolithicus]KAK0326585.1 hypothetical protein LTR82_002427 [Friedmanniomyces endolithicus]KAK1017536.1 hypothetical protein LTR54_002194 [Friedmanniomyces endolithicus]
MRSQFFLFAAAAYAARLPFGHREGFNPGPGSDELRALEEEIAQLEEQVRHDAGEFQHHHHQPAPYWGASPTSYSSADASLLTSSIPASLPVSATLPIISSVTNTVAALQSLSSIAANYSSVLSVISSVNATATLASTDSSSPLSSYAPTSTPVDTTASSASSSSALVSPVAPSSTPVPYSISSPATSGSSVTTSTYTTQVVSTLTSTYTTVCPYEETHTVGGTTSTSTGTTNVTSTLTSTYQSTLTVTATATATLSAGYSSAPQSYAPGNSSASGYSTVSLGSSVSLHTAVASPSPITSASSTTLVGPSIVSVVSPTIPSKSANGTTTVLSTVIVSATPKVSTNSTSAFLTGTATSTKMAPTVSAVANSTANVTSSTYCSNICNVLKLSTEYATTAVLCQAIPANQAVTLVGGPATAGCGSTSPTSITPEVDVCRITLSITTSGESEAYMEVWLPNNSTEAWNGRTLSTDNGGANGCVHYVDMQYVTSLGFAAIGDNGGHNSSAFDGGWMYFNNEGILDWVYRARHAATEAGKQVINQFYGEKPSYSYYLGCSTGGQQGLHSAQYFPDDFDGIIAGSAAADFNHLQAWSGRFVELTGLNSTDPRFLTLAQWTLVQSYIFNQCDAALDGVNDGILEDPTICKFDATAIPVCGGASNSTCLTSTQINTVEQVFTVLFNTAGDLLYPQLLYGSQIDAFHLGQLSGSIQGIAKSWYGGAVWNDSFYDATQMNQTDYAQADLLDALHGHVSGFNGDLSAFHNAGKKLLMYHGMADPLVSGANSQRYYLKVAQTMGLSNTGLDEFMRYFRISGMAHCGVGGISGAGAWMFGQSGAAVVPGVQDNVIWNMVDWVESNKAPDTILGTKFWYDTPSLGLEFERPHCRFPYRTTYSGSGAWTDPANWGCVFISDWQTCAVGATPRLCNADGSFT